jgi:NAD(P)-dependent dehydrogenase (short-subunit alcohol dehydrogenase family)
VAIVTGASRGLGLALTASLAADGWAVVVDARDAAALHRAVNALPGDVLALPGDITDAVHRGDLVAAAAQRGDIRAVVASAGALGPSPLPALATVGLDAFSDVLEANTVAQLGLVQAALPHLAAGAAILLVTSDAARNAYPGWGVYGASKAALEQLAAVLAVEHPALRVYAADPGDLRTAMHQAAFPGEDIGDRPLPETAVPGLRRLLDGDLPSGRHTTAEFLADVPS